MRTFKRTRYVLAVIGLAALTGCTVHPQGESQERKTALSVGKAYEKPFEKRIVPALSDHPTREELVRYAFRTNADLEQQYWKWRSAIEQIPIDGTQATNLVLSLGSVLNNGAFALDRTSMTAGNDPMADIVLPGKLSTAAQRSLESARAAGVRFRKSQFELRRKVLSAYDDYALTAALIGLGEQNVQLLKTTQTITDARSRSGMAGQQDYLKAYNEVDLAQNNLESMRSQIPIQLAALNALLSRPPAATIYLSETLPAAGPIGASDQELLDRAAKMNPELIALADDARANRQAIHLANLQYYPDFDVAVTSDLQGVTQTLMGAITVPILRYEALHAAVNQAEANLRATQAMRRQTGNDLAAQLVNDLSTIRDTDRQLELLQKVILPRARQIVDLGRAAYQTGSATLLDFLDGERSLIDIEKLVANLQATRDKQLLDVEAIDAKELEAVTR